MFLSATLTHVNTYNSEVNKQTHDNQGRWAKSFPVLYDLEWMQIA